MIIGLTGGIGSGKTIVSKIFETMGCAVYNSDERAKELYFNPTIKQAIIKLLGTEAYLNEIVINKEYISKKVFESTSLLQKLNNIIHPEVKNDFIDFCNKQPQGTLIIKETALLFETDIYKEVNVSVLVTAPTELKIARVMKRNSISKADIEKRMQTQWSDDQKKHLADEIILNDESKPLIPQVISIIGKLNNA